MRPLPHYVVALAALVGAVTIMQGAGIAGELGVSPETGIENDIENVQEQLSNQVDSDQRGVGSIIGLAISAVSLSFSMVELVILFPAVLNNLGVPLWLAIPASFPVYVIGMFFIAGVMRGMGLI